MKILFHTIGNHVVSSQEEKKLWEAFDSVGIERTENEDDCDIVLVKGFSRTWDEVKHIPKPKVLLHIGVNYGLHQNLENDNKVVKEFYEKADAVVSISDFAKLITEQVFPKRNNPLDRTIYMAGKPNLPDKYFEGEPTCITCGVWREWKRLHNTKDLAKKEGFKLLIIGEGPYEDEKIEAVGWKDEFSLYHQAHIFLNPSLHETYGNVTCEAMQHGLPVICTNHGATKEVVGDAGIVIDGDIPDIERPKMYHGVPDVDMDKFSEVYHKMIDNLDYYRQKVRDRVENELNEKVCGQKFKDLFEKLI